MKADKYFDGHNTIGVFDIAHHFTLMKYYADKWYSGDRGKLFAVRVCGEDIENFRTIGEARKYFRHCVDTYLRKRDALDMSGIIDEIIRTWKEAA